MSIAKGATSYARDESCSRSYDRILSAFDRTIAVCTGGQNLATRLAQIDDLRPGQRVLYVRVGSGEDAIAAARQGIQVTCLDQAAGMLARARERFERADLPGEFVCADLMQYAPECPFDAVACNFFLNTFTRPAMEQTLERAVSLVRPGGKLLIADFAPTRGNRFLSAAHHVFYRASNLIDWAMRRCSLHPIYDYADYYPQLGLKLTRAHRFRLFAKGPWVFQTTTAIKDRWRDAQLTERFEPAVSNCKRYDLAAASAAS